jgi:peptide/nickel transport system permease protein
MAGFVFKRILFIISVSVGIVFFCFFGLNMASNSRSPTPSYDPRPPARAAARATRAYLRGVLRGDLGQFNERVSTQTRRLSVAVRLAEAFPRSLGLLGAALAVASAVGVPLGALAATLKRPTLSGATMTFSLLGISLPSFFLAALLQAAEIGWYRATGTRLVPVGGFGWDAHMILPALVLAARPLAHLARISFVSLRDIEGEDYVRTARAKGLPQRIVLGVHEARNAAVPILTALAVSLRFSLASLPIVEYFFGWPGIGAALLDCIRTGQAEAVAGMAMAVGLTFMLVNLALDLLYRFVDPRLRERSL